ncbi:trans-sialidase, putative, partial [Trypanosoma cruzi marinkellei]
MQHRGNTRRSHDSSRPHRSSQRRTLPRTPLTAPAQRHGLHGAASFVPAPFLRFCYFLFPSFHKQKKNVQNNKEKRESVEAHPEGKKEKYMRAGRDNVKAKNNDIRRRAAQKKKRKCGGGCTQSHTKKREIINAHFSFLHLLVISLSPPPAVVAHNTHLIPRHPPLPQCPMCAAKRACAHVAPRRHKRRGCKEQNNAWSNNKARCMEINTYYPHKRWQQEGKLTPQFIWKTVTVQKALNV